MSKLTWVYVVVLNISVDGVEMYERLASWMIYFDGCVCAMQVTWRGTSKHTLGSGHSAVMCVALPLPAHKHSRNTRTAIIISNHTCARSVVKVGI